MNNFPTFKEVLNEDYVSLSSKQTDPKESIYRLLKLKN